MNGWFYATAALLVVSGIGKLIDPAPVQGALRAAGLPSRRSLVTLLSLVEAGVGVTNLLTRSATVALAQAALYLGFGGFVVYALARRLPIASCGCFGKADTPPSALHVLLNLGAGGGAVWYASEGRGLDVVISGQPLLGLPYLGFVGLATYCLYLLLGEMPRLRVRS